MSLFALCYFDDVGREIVPPGGSEASATNRARIAEIEIHLVALERHPDAVWVDPADADPSTVHYRKSEMLERVALRNVGRVARAEGA